MWIFTKIGFLSIVQKQGSSDPNAELCVRSRFQEDIESFIAEVKEVTGEDVGTYLEDSGSDYAFRAFIPRPLVTAVISNLVETLDASNFKDSIHGDPIRDDAYYQCWDALYDAQHRAERGS